MADPMTDPTAQPFSEKDDYQSLTHGARQWLVTLGNGPLNWAYTRSTPPDLGALLGRGLAFRSHYAITITEKGLAVLDRVA